MQLFERKLHEWKSAGILPDDVFQNILAYENHDKKKHKVPLLLTIGLIFFALAVFSFIAANWQVIPDLIRIVMMVAFMWIFYTFAHFSETKNFGWPILFQILGLAMFGATIIVFSQTFHITSSGALLPWAILLASLIHLYVYRKVAYEFISFIFGIVTILTIIESVIWLEWLLLVALLLTWFYFTSSILSKYFSWILLFASGLLLWTVSDYNSPLYPIWTLYTLVALLVISKNYTQQLRPLYLIFAGAILTGYLIFRSETNLSLVELNLTETILLLIAGLAITAFTWMKYRSITWIGILGVIGLLLFDNSAIALAALAELTALAYLIVAQKQNNRLFSGFLYFIVVQLVIYFIFAWDRLDMSLFFLIGSVILISLSTVGWFIKRKKEGVTS